MKKLVDLRIILTMNLIILGCQDSKEESSLFFLLLAKKQEENLYMLSTDRKDGTKIRLETCIIVAAQGSQQKKKIMETQIKTTHIILIKATHIRGIVTILKKMMIITITSPETYPEAIHLPIIILNFLKEVKIATFKISSLSNTLKISMDQTPISTIAITTTILITIIIMALTTTTITIILITIIILITTIIVITLAIIAVMQAITTIITMESVAVIALQRQDWLHPPRTHHSKSINPTHHFKNSKFSKYSKPSKFNSPQISNSSSRVKLTSYST